MQIDQTHFNALKTYLPEQDFLEHLSKWSKSAPRQQCPEILAGQSPSEQRGEEKKSTIRLKHCKTKMAKLLQM